MEALSTQARKWQEYFIYFLFYSIIGWCYEIFLDVVIYQTGFVNRGFLFGPYCPVYGVGTLIFLFCLGSLQKKKILLGKLNITPILVFLGIIAITTGIELLASYLLDMTGGGQLWDYSEYAWNFQG
ncbi:MAG: putative ABC transporter permease, partial [Clostridiales bacterium]